MIFSLLVIGPIFSNFSLASLGASGLDFKVGGYITYKINGTNINDTKPGTIAALAQSNQPIVWLIEFKVSVAQSGFAAIAVKNMADEIQEV
jgi:hypothetical protein